MSPIRMDTVVGPGGKVELTVPLPAGMPVQVVVQDPASEPEVEWDDHLQSRLENMDSGGLDPRPWREVLDDARARLRARRPAP